MGTSTGISVNHQTRPKQDRSALTIRLLGELQLADANGAALALPASKKTRALLGYLIATEQPHRRERLCDLFWDGPDDPRAELRWSLSKIRPLFGKSSAKLVADRQHVAVELGDVSVDRLTIASLIGDDLAGASTAALKQAFSRFGGEFLDGLDLPACYRYQEWCMAERESVSRLRLSVLATLLHRLRADPETALPYARALTISDPLSEAGHAAVVRLLADSGRKAEALAHYDRAHRILTTELGAAPCAELKEAHRHLQSAAAARPVAPTRNPLPDTVPLATPMPSRSSAMIGRVAEQAMIRQVVDATTRREASEIILVTGEPGIGKSHLLNCVAQQITSAGDHAWTARGFEPEAMRPYGIWFDILRVIAGAIPPHMCQANLRLVLAEGGMPLDLADRGRFFDAVLDLLRQIARERTVALLLDDMQWVDEASASLLHYVARHLGATPGVLLVCAVRSGEFYDNAALSSAVRSIGAECRLRVIKLKALGRAETIEFVRSIDSALDASGIFAESQGNPLYALELARARRSGVADGGRTIEALISGQLARLSEHAHEVLLWAAASGRTFTPDHLARAARIDGSELVMALGELERRGLVRPVSDDAYDFAHDLVRQTTYRSISQPRRKLLHRHIARTLQDMSKHDPALASDLAYHAALAGDHEIAARAYATAGEHSLRLFANRQASSLAERGLRHVVRMPASAAKAAIHISLLKIRVLSAAGPGMRPLPPLVDTLVELAGSAERLGIHAAASTAHYLLSVLHQEAGDTQNASISTLRAAASGRFTDENTRANQLANTARCLLELELEIDRARELIRESNSLADPAQLELCELHWAKGLLQRWTGNLDTATLCLDRALGLARMEEDRWREYKCLTWLAILGLERGRYSEMQAHCASLTAVARRLKEDETPFVSILDVLARLGRGEDVPETILADALNRLRGIDDKSYLAYALNNIAYFHLMAGQRHHARRYAVEALNAASAMRRRNEAAIARAMLAQVGDSDLAEKAEALSLELANLSARAQKAVLFLQGMRDSNAGFHGAQ